MIKKIVLSVIVGFSLICSSCQDWLEVFPKNEQLTVDFWQTKEEVESVLSSGYMYLRRTAPILYDWSELRGASIHVYVSNEGKRKLQNFQMTSADNLSDWTLFYKVINMANSVLDYAPEVYEVDESYHEAVMGSHLTEAYFLRGLAYFFLVRNFRDVPLVLRSYVDDSAPFEIAKSDEKEVIEQIKTDVRTALELGTAKEFFVDEDYWPGVSKGRATKWALYALMVDVCLWSEDYNTAIEYADLLINATAIRRPVFMRNQSQWFEMFFPGNSNESIFEIQWDYERFAQTDGSPSAAYTYGTLATYQYTEAMAQRLLEEKQLNSERAEFGAYAEVGTSGQYCVWKYQGLGDKDVASIRPSNLRDANYIIYRMADVMLMKAEAMIWRGNAGDNQGAIEIINEVRERSGLLAIAGISDDTDQLSMLQIVLQERDMEFAAEGKRWYDLLRFGRTDNHRYKEQFIQTIVENNQSASPSWLNSVLSNNNAWFLPIRRVELDSNPLLKQNPYYGK